MADWPDLRQANLRDGRDLKSTADLRALSENDDKATNIRDCQNQKRRKAGLDDCPYYALYTDSTNQPALESSAKNSSKAHPPQPS
jgi:hypothetical protein